MLLVNTSSGTLYISPAPFAEDLELMDPFDIIWNLAKEYSFIAKEEEEFANKVILANINDYDVPSNVAGFGSQLFEVITCLRAGGNVLIHCAGGKGRTGMALALVKHYLDGMPIMNCLKFTKQTCNGPETLKQTLFVINFASTK